MRLISFLTEATRPFQSKVIDPALMTYDEYYKLVNPQEKWHPSTAYDHDIAQLNAYQSPEKYPVLLNTITRNGLRFQVRQRVEDRHQGNYVKTTPDGYPVRGQSGEVLYMSPEEVAAMIPASKRFHYDHAIVDMESNMLVGVTENEWGTLLVMVATEYRKFGFGTLLVKLSRDKAPDRQSGGFTSSGAENLRRVHAEWVREYMASGFYSYLVRTEQITAERARQVIGSVTLDRPNYKQQNLRNDDPRDWLLMSDGQSFVILYDRKIYDLDEPDDTTQQHRADRYILGMASLASYGTGSPPRINRVYGTTDRITAYMLEVIMNQEIGTYIRMDEIDADILRNHLGKQFRTEQGRPGDIPKHFINAETTDWKKPARIEQAYRNKRDPYREWYARIIEWAEALADK